MCFHLESELSDYGKKNKIWKFNSEKFENFDLWSVVDTNEEG